MRLSWLIKARLPMGNIDETSDLNTTTRCQDDFFLTNMIATHKSGQSTRAKATLKSGNDEVADWRISTSRPFEIVPRLI